MATATGIHHRSYRAELRLRHTKAEWARLALVFLALLVAPYILTVYWLSLIHISEPTDRTRSRMPSSA